MVSQKNAMAPAPRPSDTLTLGTPKSSWTYSHTTGYDLTHKPPRDSSKPLPRLWMKTAVGPIILNPRKTALITVDLQNFFLSRSLGHHQGPLHEAEEILREVAIPAARRAGIQVVHLTWGFSPSEAEAAPPAILRRFSPYFEDGSGRRAGVGVSCRRSTCSSRSVHHHDGQTGPAAAAAAQRHSTVGDEMGPVTIWNGRVVDAGRKLIRGAWNADLYESTRREFLASADTPLPDARFHKTRASGFFSQGGGVPAVVKFLRKRGITTVLLGGVGTEEGVWASAQDAANWGFDVVLLADGCGTLAGIDVSRTVESCAVDLGFMSTCLDFSRGVANMLGGM